MQEIKKWDVIIHISDLSTIYIFDYYIPVNII